MLGLWQRQASNAPSGDGSVRNVSRAVGAARTVGVTRTASLLQRNGAGGERLHEQSIRVRENAAAHFEANNVEWMLSRSGLIFYSFIRSLYCIGICIVLLLCKEEIQQTYLWFFLLIRAIGSVIKVVSAHVEYRRRQRILAELGPEHSPHSMMNGMVLTSFDPDLHQQLTNGRRRRECEEGLGVLLMVAFMINWVIGLYTIIADGNQIVQDSPLLYWSCVLLFSIDILTYAVVPCCLGVCILCCLTVFIAFNFHPVNRGASEDIIRGIPTYKFRRDPMAPPSSVSMTASSSSRPSSSTAAPAALATSSSLTEDSKCGGVMVQEGNPQITRTLLGEDASCCICWSNYEDGAELQELPCHHHFHKPCIDKWLRINATCPLCKAVVGQHANIAQP
eukprot:TRINITY_DN15879_c0_g2_i1.p1 TRINITY_DN15879_c0_g2~~TRINITY_DN15879_c0_g2_i1.p1  ORF type:complete len:392 (+),score=39.35 TRINITY_DN15879_c0_g2_i1:146-1321(+)